jgi:hypothetical protein
LQAKRKLMGRREEYQKIIKRPFATDCEERSNSGDLLSNENSHFNQKVYPAPTSGAAFDLSPPSSSLTRTLAVNTSFDSLPNGRTLMPMEAFVML